MSNNFSCIYKDGFECVTDHRKCLGACYPECEICEHAKSEEDSTYCKECLHKDQKPFHIEK